MWLVAVLGMVGVASWMIVEKFVHFFNYPVDTRTTIVNENHLEIPSVTFCNMNKFRYSYLVALHHFMITKQHDLFTHKTNCCVLVLQEIVDGGQFVSCGAGDESLVRSEQIKPRRRRRSQ